MFEEKTVIKYWLFYVSVITISTLLFEFKIIEFVTLHFKSAFIWGTILFIYVIGFEFLNIALLSIYNNIFILTIIYAVKELITIFLLTIIVFSFVLSFYSYKPDILRDEFILMVLFILVISIFSYWLYSRLDLGNRIEVTVKNVVEFIFKSSNPVPLSKDIKAKVSPKNIEKIIVMVGIILTILIAANSVFNNISSPAFQEEPNAFDYEIILLISILSVYALNIYLLLKSLDFNESIIKD